MIYKIINDQHFQVLSDSFSVSPSETGYELYFSANGIDFSPFTTVAAGQNKQFVNMSNGNYYYLSGNVGTVEVNWERSCGGGGSGSGSGVSSLDGQTGALTTKTINGNAILGEGDIEIEGGGDNTYYVDGDNINSYSGIVDEIYHKLSSGETAYATVKYDYAKYPVAKAEIYEYQEGQPGDPDYLRQEGFQIIAARFGSDGYAIRSGIVRAFRYEGRDGNGYSCGQGWDYTLPAGGAAQYDLDAMSQAERAEFVAMCENLTEIEREELLVYRDKSICRYDHSEGSGDSFKIGFFDYRQDGWSYPLTFFRHFFVKADGTYEQLSNTSYANIITFNTTYSDTAHTLSNSDGLSPIIPISNLNSGDGKMAINLRLLIGNNQTVLSSKAWSERAGNLEGKICAEWHYSGNVITAVWNVVEHTATIASWTEVPEGGSGGPTIVNLDALSQAELTALYEQLSGETTASTVNEDYIFLKSFTQVHGGNKVPFRVQFLGYFSYKVRFGYSKPDNGHAGEIWILFVDVKDNGEMETSMVPNYTFPGFSKFNVIDRYEWVKFDFSTSAITTSDGSQTIYTGDTGSGAWVFDFDKKKDFYRDTYVPCYKFKIADATFNDRTFASPTVSYEELATPVSLSCADGATRPFGYVFYFDYGYFTVSMYVDGDQNRYARFTVTKN